MKSSQAPAHYANAVKAAKRALRIQTAATTEMEHMFVKHHL